MKLAYVSALAIAALAVTACQKKPEPTAREEKPMQLTPAPVTPAPAISDPYATEQPTRTNVQGVLPPPPAAKQVQPAPGAAPGVAAPAHKTTAAKATASTYTVKAGDTLTKIAKQHGTTVKKIEAANPQITDPNKLKVGEKLRIPK